MSRVDLDALAADLGITTTRAAALLAEAIGAGFLSVVELDDSLVLQATVPTPLEDHP